MKAVHSHRLFKALQDAGVLADEKPENVKKVTITLEVGRAVVINVERIDAEGLMQVLPRKLAPA